MSTKRFTVFIVEISGGCDFNYGPDGVYSASATFYVQGEKTNSVEMCEMLKNNFNDYLDNLPESETGGVDNFNAPGAAFVEYVSVIELSDEELGSFTKINEETFIASVDVETEEVEQAEDEDEDY